MTTRLYGIVWRWHFAAGLVACPVLVVLALTGAIYTFQVELERAWKPALFDVTPGAARLPIDTLVAAAPCTPASVVLDPDPAHAVMVWCTVVDGALQRFGADPYRGALVGPDDFNASFFGVVFRLHWELLLGERGRLIVEWATSWAVLLMASGAYLWWPRGRRTGTWWPRRELAGRQRLRDLHAVAGAYALPVLLAVAATGLCWTRLAGGERWARVANDASEAAWAAPPKSVVHGARIGVDRALAAAGIVPGHEPRAVYVALPQAPEDPYVLYAYATDHSVPSAAASLWIDAYSGGVLRRVGWAELSAMGAVSNTLYAVHVGSIAGLPGRIAVLVAALVLAGLCATGPWMWWKRRPRGGLGIPPPARRTPGPLYALLAGLGWLLPMVGYTLLVLVAVEAIVWLVRRRAA